MNYTDINLRKWKDQYGRERTAYIQNCLGCSAYLNDDRPCVVRCPPCHSIYKRAINNERKRRAK